MSICKINGLECCDCQPVCGSRQEFVITGIKDITITFADGTKQKATPFDLESGVQNDYIRGGNGNSVKVNDFLRMSLARVLDSQGTDFEKWQ